MTESLFRVALKRPYVWTRTAVGSALFDRRYGVETGGQVDLADLDVARPGRSPYVPAFVLSLRRILPRREVDGRDVFVDFGSGKGRVVLQAALWYPFRRVEGVELAEQLHAVAQRNLQVVRDRLRCRDVRLVRSDVLDYDIPDDVTVAFFYNPFQGAIFEAVLAGLLESVDRAPRRLRIVYGNPQEEATLLRSGRVRLVRRVRGWRPGREWSRSNSYRLYEVVPRPATDPHRTSPSGPG